MKLYSLNLKKNSEGNGIRFTLIPLECFSSTRDYEEFNRFEYTNYIFEQNCDEFLYNTILWI